MNKWLLSEREEIRTMAFNMISKFEKYYKNVHGILVVATILDTRYKMKLIELFFL